jgi:hypothetical protein
MLGSIRLSCLFFFFQLSPFLKVNSPHLSLFHVYFITRFLIHNLISFTTLSESVCQIWCKNQSAYCKCEATMNEMKYSFIYLTESELIILKLEPSSFSDICLGRRTCLSFYPPTIHHLFPVSTHYTLYLNSRHSYGLSNTKIVFAQGKSL